jgi:peptidyl-dipeptidase Dcp
VTKQRTKPKAKGKIKARSELKSRAKPQARLKSGTKSAAKIIPRGSASANPLLARWTAPFGMPPFDKIKPEHFRSAFAAGFKEHKAEIAAIARQTSRPTFANTIAALEKSGRLLERVSALFFNLCGADTNEKLQELEREFAPRLAAHYTAIMLNPKIFARVDDLYERRDALELTDEQRRVLELQHLWLVRAGARLTPKAKKRMAEISERLASLATTFSQNVLKDEQSWRLVLDGERDLAGLPEPVRAAAARAAADMDPNGRLAGKHVITLSRSSVEPFLQFSARRDLREQAFTAWIKRGEMGGATDNRKITAEIVALRNEMAALMGFTSYADYSLDDTMAKTPAAVRDLLMAVWPAAVKRASEEREALQRRVRAEGGNFEIAAWDWRYYAEKERKALYDIDEAATRPYLTLESVIAAAFDTASRLFGLRFKELKDAPRYHEDVRVWEVTDKRGAHVGLFLGDYFARPSKRSGAWMSSFRPQSKVSGDVRPIIVNVMNFAQGGKGEPTLLSLDDARTLFHEFGHGLHGLLSDVTYPSISGTSVSRDFVELPSQLYEHWLMVPEVLERFARHHETGKPMPAKLLSRIKKAHTFNQGFATVEYAASALVDLDLHTLEDARDLDVAEFERATLERAGMPREIVMRHRIPHFLHIVGGYAAGYYSYLWSEVMDADAFAAFKETGDPFDKATAKRLKEFIYAGGNTRDPLQAYVAFRGRPPEISGMLKKRGLAN